MLNRLVELAQAKKQVNIAFTYLNEEKFILGIAPANAGNDKILPFIAKGTVEEIMNNLHHSANLPDYVAAALAAKAPAAKEPEADEEDSEIEDAARCQKGDSNGSRCLLDKEHVGKCRFTPAKEIKSLGERQPSPDIGKLTEAPEKKDAPDVELPPVEEPEQRCRVCGCTEMTPCHTDSGPCSWVEKDLCSACQAVESAPAATPVKQATFEF
jgi:hypothetical protein